MQPKTVFLLVHGFGGSSWWWDPLVSVLEKSGRVVAVDLPGHGQASWNGESLADMADQVFDALCLSRDEMVFGFSSSFGGLVMLKLWQKHPDIFSRMVFAGALPRFTATVDFPAGLTSGKIDKLSGQLKGDRAAVMGMFFRSLFTSQERLSSRYESVKALWQMTPVPTLVTLEGFLMILAAEDLRDVMARVRVPVQMILGDADPICPLVLAAPLKELCPALRVEVMKGCGHFPFLSQPQVFIKLVEGIPLVCP
ncbi:MAG: alpha/beta fold hydrolase [Candidatus Omnitrophota bacterium]